MVNIYSNQQEQIVTELLSPHLNELKFKIVKLTIDTNSRNKIKNCIITIEKFNKHPVNIKDCKTVYQYLFTLIRKNRLNLIDYSIEVSSPGINKPLTRHEDFLNAINLPIKVQTLYKVNNQKNFMGQLCKVDHSYIIIKNIVNNEIYKIKLTEIFEAYLKIY